MSIQKSGVGQQVLIDGRKVVGRVVQKDRQIVGGSGGLLDEARVARVRLDDRQDVDQPHRPPSRGDLQLLDQSGEPRLVLALPCHEAVPSRRCLRLATLQLRPACVHARAKQCGSVASAYSAVEKCGDAAAEGRRPSRDEFGCELRAGAN